MTFLSPGLHLAWQVSRCHRVRQAVVRAGGLQDSEPERDRDQAEAAEGRRVVLQEGLRRSFASRRRRKMKKTTIFSEKILFVCFVI